MGRFVVGCSSGVDVAAVIRFVLGLFLAVFLSPASADYPAASGAQFCGGLPYTSCTLEFIDAGWSPPYQTETRVASVQGATCGFSLPAYPHIGFYGICNPTAPTLTCPNGGTLSGSTCLHSCPSGQVEQSDGSCVVSCPVAGSSAMVGGAAAWKISGGSSACVSGFSYSGCAVKCTSGASSGGSAACTGCTFTGSPGESSTPNGTPVPPEQKTNPTTPEGCLASGKGYVTSSSGVTTCISGTEAPASQPVQTTEKTKTVTTNEQGQSTTTEGTKTTECSGGNCTETTSSTGPNGTSTVAEEKPASNFCAENPTSPMCKEAKDPCEDHPERLGCLEKGDPEDGDALPSEDRGVTSVTPVSFSSSASCPADVNLPKGAKLSYAYPCEMATSLRPIILAIAWLIAGFIVMGAFRDG